MILADVIILWIAGVLLIGFVGFFAVLISLLARGIRWVGRSLVPAGEDPDGTAGRHEYSPRICEHPRCGYLNRGDARYCARCGQPLT